MALQTAVQGRAPEVRNGLLERVKAVIQGQERLLTEQDDGGFFGRREHGGSGGRTAHGLVGTRALAPLGHRFRINAETLG